MLRQNHESKSWEWQILQEWQSPTTSHRQHSWEWEIKLPDRHRDVSPGKFLEGEARYKILERLGKGTFGEVCAARDLKVPGNVAIKRISDAFASYVCAKRTLREVRLLRLLDTHNNLIKMRTILPISTAI
jgi:serine/threonine protein kinase